MMFCLHCLLLLTYSVGYVKAISTYYLDERCNQIRNLPSDEHAVRVNATKEQYYPHELNCTFTLVVEEDSEEIMLYFKYLDIRPDDGCAHDWLEVHDGNSTKSPPVCGIIDLVPGKENRICAVDDHPPDGLVYRTHRNSITFHFKTGKNTHYRGFETILTRFRYEPCDIDEFQCTNRRCIDKSLRCNGLNPCGDHSDCTDDQYINISVWAFVGACVGCLVLGIVMASIIPCLWRKKCKKPHDPGREPLHEAPPMMNKLDS